MRYGTFLLFNEMGKVVNVKFMCVCVRTTCLLYINLLLLL